MKLWKAKATFNDGEVRPAVLVVELMTELEMKIYDRGDYEWIAEIFDRTDDEIFYYKYHTTGENELTKIKEDEFELTNFELLEEK